jgi:hypothetical protein
MSTRLLAVSATFLTTNRSRVAMLKRCRHGTDELTDTRRTAHRQIGQITLCYDESQRRIDNHILITDILLHPHTCYIDLSLFTLAMLRRKGPERNHSIPNCDKGDLKRRMYHGAAAFI